MCRLAAWIGAPVSPSRLLFGGSHSLHRQSWQPKQLLSGSVNADGWGVAWYREGRPRRLGGAQPIWQEPNLEEALSSIESSIVVGAVRNITPGLPSDSTGNPPLLFEGWTFALNGFIQDFRPRFMRHLRAQLSDELYGELRGASDTETLFLLTVARMKEGMSPGEALSEVYDLVGALVRAEGSAAQLNILLADGSTIHALRASTTDVSNSLYVKESEDGVAIASEPLDLDENWIAAPHQTLLKIDRAGLVEKYSIG